MVKIRGLEPDEHHADAKPYSKRKVSAYPEDFLFPDVPVVGLYAATQGVANPFANSQESSILARIQPRAGEVHGDIHEKHDVGGTQTTYSSNAPVY